MKFIIAFLILTNSFVFASASKSTKCEVELESDDMELHWEAYKLPAPNKTGVKGTLRNLGLKEEYKGESIEKILDGMEFNIDARSVWTRNSMRDAKLVKFFFGKMVGGTYIKGKIIKLHENSMKVLINMNGLSKEAVLKVTRKEQRLVAEGTIDILDWAMDKSLAALNKACFDLHKGKTWSDVSIKLMLSYENNCD